MPVALIRLGPGLVWEAGSTSVERLDIEFPDDLGTGKGEYPAMSLRDDEAAGSGFGSSPVAGGPEAFSGLPESLTPFAPHPVDMTVWARFRDLSPIEREMVTSLAEGQSGEEVSRRLGIPELAGEFCRGGVFRKMGAESLVDLLIMARICGVG